MDSFEVLKEAIKQIGAKSVATDMSLSTSLVYKWCESQEGGGADNPLDRVLTICKLTDSVQPVEWLCEQTNGFRVDNPEDVEHEKGEVLRSTQSILKDFTELLETVSESYNDDNRIDLEEAENIRRSWEALKSTAESFVLACEKGVYNTEDA